MENKALSKAIKLAGGLTALAEHLGISKQAVAAWHRCPPHQVLKVEEITGVQRYDLRPDIYGPRP